MFDWLAQYSPKEMIGLSAVVGGLLLAATAVLSAQWARVRRAELQAQQAEAELALKQQMIERGMSAEEIVKVLAAGQPAPGQTSSRKSMREKQASEV